MDPDNQPASQPTNQPVGNTSVHGNLSADKSKKTRKIVIMAALALILLLAIIGVVVSLSGNGKKKGQDTSSIAQPSELTRDPSAIDIENVNNSISSSITGLDDEKDFPATNLEDKNLEL